MSKRNSTLSIAAIVAASAFMLQAPIAGAAGNTAAAGSSTTTTTQSAETQRGVPGVEMNVGRNANDGGVPGVEMNVGRDGDQNNIDMRSDSNTRTLGAGADTGTASDGSLNLPARADRN